MFRSSNPTLNNQYFRSSGPAQSWGDLDADFGGKEARRTPASAKHMTLAGTTNKAGVLIGICTAAAVGGFVVTESNPGLGYLLMGAGAILGFILTLVCAFKPQAAPFTALPVALAYGAFAGGFSYVIPAMLGAQPGAEASANADAPGWLHTSLILNALVLTMTIAGGLLASYKFGLIRPGKIFRNAVAVGGVGLMLFAGVGMVAALFGNNAIIDPWVNPTNGSLLSIGLSLFLVVFASASLVIDFDEIANGARNKAPKYYEWYGAQSLLVTLVFLYVEVLRLLAKLQSRE